MKRESTIALLFIVLASGAVFAQSTTGNVEGWIVDPDGRPVISANVIASSTELLEARGAATDRFGYFRLSSLPVGNYSVKISHIAYKPLVLEGIRLVLGQTTTLGQIQLQSGIIQMDEIVVTVNSPVIDGRSAGDGMSISQNQFAELPIERNLFRVAELLPRANTSYKKDGGTNISGSTGIENRYFIDGSEVTGTEAGLLLYDLPYNFIREVEVRTGGYEAEFQSSLGGVVNTITHSGGNDFHGSVFGFLTNNNFSGTPRLSAGDPPKGDYANFDVGVGLGGPVLRDRLWFYGAYSPNVISEDVYANGIGFLKSRTTRHKFAGKLSWNVNTDNQITVSMSGNPYSGQTVGSTNPTFEVLDPACCTRTVDYMIVNAAVKGYHSIGKAFSLESQLSFAVLDGNQRPSESGGSEPGFTDYVDKTISGGQGFSRYAEGQRALNVGIKGIMNLPGHVMKAGAGYSRTSAESHISWEDIARYQGYYETYVQKVEGTVSQDNVSLFVQDSWQISPRLCLNIGVRWDPQWLIASDGKTAQKILDPVQPRLGIIYQPGELGTQKITASFGRFYQPLLLSLSLLYHVKGSEWYFTDYPNDPRVDTTGAWQSPNLASFVTNVPNVKGQYFDEYSLGYERQLAPHLKLGIKGIYRRLGQGVEDGVVSDEDQQRYGSLQVYGNPGSGPLSMLPPMRREYTAVELTLQRFANDGINFLISYVLSRNRGNYDGFAETYDMGGGAQLFPNNTDQFGVPERMVNAEGLLPNDRTHVLKVMGSYAFDFGLAAGVNFQVMSGTPLNEFGRISMFPAASFLQPRGSAGRTPTLWDLNFRFSYDVSRIIPMGFSAKLILDVLHAASRRAAIDYDQQHYYNHAETLVNPDYLTPIQFQAPMSGRLGLEVSF